VEECGRARHVTDGSIMGRMRIACWVTEATNTHSEYVTLIAFYGSSFTGRRIIVAVHVHGLSCLTR
jgi:hypothetical protein